MPTSDQGMPYRMPGSIFGEILLSVFSGSMDNNWQFGIVIMGSSVLLLMNPWMYKSPYSRVRPELNLDCVWTHKVTGLANNWTGLADFHACPPTKLVYSTHMISHRFLWVQWGKNWTDTFICHQMKAYSSAAIRLQWKVQRPKQVKKTKSNKQPTEL